jgi:TRAP-type C4-dicarboxylate transport system substrate-binding protein
VGIDSPVERIFKKRMIPIHSQERRLIMLKKSILGLLLVTFLVGTIMAAPGLVVAKGPVKLKAVTFLPKNNCFCDAFFIFQKAIEAETGGKLVIDYAGGPEAIPSFEQIEAVTNGLVDIVLLPAAYYVPQLPLVDGMKLSKLTPWEERETGAYDFVNELAQEKLNVYFLGRFSPGIQFHLYLNKKIDKPDLTGMKVRVTPIYKPFVETLGGVPVTTSPGEVYTALERGVVDGYGWPSTKISDFGWHEVTKYIIDPGFYQVDVGILMNLDTWNKLSKDLQQTVLSVSRKAEHEAAEHYAKLIKEERAFITSKGVEVIRFSPEGEKTYLDTAYKAGWEQVSSKSPKLAAQYKKLLEK